MEEKRRGVVEELFDVSFSTLVTPRIIKVLYALSIIASAFIAIVLIVEGFSESLGRGILTLVFVGPLVFLILVISSRIVYELAIVVFRISENTAEISRQVTEMVRLAGKIPTEPPAA